MKEKLEDDGISNFKVAQVMYEPNQEIKILKEKAEKILNFIEKLEDDDDVQEVYHNLSPDSLNE